MTVRQSAVARPRPVPSPEHQRRWRRQREHELNQALEAARTLQARLEMLGDRASDVAVVHSLRDSLSRDLVSQKQDVDHELIPAGEENAVPLKRILEEDPR